MTGKVEIIFTHNEQDETIIQGERGKICVALEGEQYLVARWDWFGNNWSIISRGWKRFGDALHFACGLAA